MSLTQDATLGGLANVHCRCTLRTRTCACQQSQHCGPVVVREELRSSPVRSMSLCAGQGAMSHSNALHKSGSLRKQPCSWHLQLHRRCGGRMKLAQRFFASQVVTTHKNLIPIRKKVRPSLHLNYHADLSCVVVL